MPFAIKLSPSAIEDLREIFVYYELKSKGWGERFLNAVDNSLNSIANTPGIVYRVFHTSRQPLGGK